MIQVVLFAKCQTDFPKTRISLHASDGRMRQLPSVDKNSPGPMSGLTEGGSGAASRGPSTMYHGLRGKQVSLTGLVQMTVALIFNVFIYLKLYK